MFKWLFLCVVCVPALLENKLPADETSNPASSGVTVEVDPSDATVRDSIVRSLPFLETAGTAWMEERGCMSCHHVPFMIWAHRAAQTKGVMVDTKKLADWDEWARTDSLSHRNTFKLEKALFAALDPTAIPDAVRTKLAPMVDQEFPAERDFVARLTQVLQPEELTAYQTVLVHTSKLPIYSASSSGGGLDVLGQLLLSRDDAAENLAVGEFYNGALNLMERMQLSDGSWLTQSRNISNTTVPERLAARDEIYHYWGTAWATLGLLETLHGPGQ